MSKIIKIFFRTTLRILGVILMLLLMAFLYLSIKGVPRRFLDLWLADLRSAGYCVTVEQVRLDLLDGIVAERFQAFADEKQPLPMFEAGRVALFINPLDWFRHRTGLRRLHVRNGLLRLALVERPVSDDADTLVLRNVNGAMRFDADQWRLTDLTADLLSLNISAHGLIRVPRAVVRPATTATAPKKGVLSKLDQLTDSQRGLILALVKQLNAITFGIQPHTDITFEIDMENPSVNKATVRMEGAATRAFGVSFDQWRFLMELKDKRAHLTEAWVQLQDQYIKFSGSYSFTNQVVDARVAGKVIPEDWMILAPTLTSNQVEIISSLVVNDSPLIVEVDFSGRADRDDPLWVAGNLRVRNFAYNTVPVTSFQSRFGYTNGILALDEVKLVLAKGEMTGRVAVDIDNDLADIDLVSTADPQAVIRLIDPDMAELFDDFIFAGQVRVTAKGRVDYGTGALTALRARIDGADWGYSPFLTDRCSMNLTLKQLRFDLTDIQADIFEGTLSGKASFYPVGTNSNFRYEVSAKVNDVSFKTLLHELGFKGDKDYEGEVYSECLLSGFFRQGRGDTATGGGWVRIQHGQFYQLRLFGGLSGVISALYPGQGIARLTDFSVNFAVKDRKITTQDARFGGNMFTVKAEGYYAFDSNLDFIVWIQPGKQPSLVSRITSLITPIDTLLAFRMTGTLSDPKWWPLNLTKDQLLGLPKKLLITVPKNVLIGLPQELLLNLPQEVLITLPYNLLVKLPKEIFIDLPQELFIKLPANIWNFLKKPGSSKVNE